MQIIEYPERGSWQLDLSTGSGSYPIAESPVIDTRGATTIRMQLVKSDASRVDMDVLGSLGLGYAPIASTVLSKNYNRVLNIPVGFNEIKLKVATGDYTAPTTVNYKVVMRV